MSCIILKRDVSSANYSTLEDNSSDKSFRSIKNNNTPRIEPSGMPTVTFSNVDFWPLRTNLCFLSLKNSDKISGRLPDIPFCYGLNITSLCYTLSKALEISRKTFLTSNPCVMDNSWLKQESQGLNNASNEMER